MTKEYFEWFMIGYLAGILTPIIIQIIGEIKLMFKEW